MDGSGLGLDPWKALGLERTANRLEIRAAYKKLVLKCYPDKVVDPELKAEKQGEFEQVQRAFMILNNDSEREKWEEMELRMQVRAHAKAQANARAQARTQAGSTSNTGSSPRLRHYGSEDLDRRRLHYSSSPSSSDGGGGTVYYRVSDGNTWETHPYQVPRERRWEREREKPRQTERDRERQDFLKFALQLFDEVSLDSCYDSVCGLNIMQARASGASMPFAADTYRPGQSNSASDNMAGEGNTSRNMPSPPGLAQESVAAIPVDAKPPETRPDDQPEVEPGPENVPAKPNRLYAVPPAQLSLEQMNPDLEDPLVDFVAVHGLGAIPDITWKEKNSGKVWLSDKSMLPAAIPRARILRFGYDSLWMGDTPIRTTLSTIAIKLLVCLSVARAVG